MRVPAALPAKPRAPEGDGLRLVRYKALFSGPAVERISELQFQRPAAEVELSPEDARERAITNGASVLVSHDGTSKALRARVSPKLRAGIARIADEHAEGLGGMVEVKAAP